MCVYIYIYIYILVYVTNYILTKAFVHTNILLLLKIAEEKLGDIELKATVDAFSAIGKLV